MVPFDLIGIFPTVAANSSAKQQLPKKNCPKLPRNQEGVGRGQITEFPGRKDCVIDCVPVDYVCNVVIAAAQRVGIEASQEPVKVYQCASGAL